MKIPLPDSPPACIYTNKNDCSVADVKFETISTTKKPLPTLSYIREAFNKFSAGGSNTIIYSLLATSALITPTLAQIDEFEYYPSIASKVHSRSKLACVFAEWAAVLPLAFYFCTFHQDHRYAGRVALEGRLSVGFFPKLWALRSVIKLLKERQLFFDLATDSVEPLLVFDIQWGHEFRCSNSTAAFAIAYAVLEKDNTLISLDDLKKWIIGNKHTVARRLSTEGNPFDEDSIPEIVNTRLGRQRKQTLHVMFFRRSETTGRYNGDENWEKPKIYRTILKMAVLLSLAASLIATGIYATGTLLVFGAFTQLFCRYVILKRPEAYLNKNEQHPGCMLVSPHGNSSTWYLFLGNVGVVDTVCNKPMIEIPEQYPPLIWWFQTVQIVQLAAMALVAVRKRWDGICLLVLIIIALSIELWRGETRHANGWLHRNNITCDAVTIELPGRHDLMGVVQLMSTQKNTKWMSGPLPDCSRREVLLKKIGAVYEDPGRLASLYRSLIPFDQYWVDSTAMQTLAGVSLLKAKLNIPEQ